LIDVPSSHLRVRRALVAALVGGLLASACVGARPELAAEADTTTTTAPTTTTTEPPPLAEVAQAESDQIEVFPDAISEVPSHVSGPEVTSVPNIPLVFLVKDERDDRLEVYLPGAPPGRTGWVRAEDVTVSSVPYKLEIAFTAHRLRVYDRGEVVFDEPIGLGPAERPVPGQLYFLKELVDLPDADGAYGSYAYGLSGYPTVLEGYRGDAGVVGIHGTNAPEAIGAELPEGSVGLANAAIERLVNEIGLPLGTPVEIIA
jgi:lipoprotein-anchoring transpeptidase ErfK/SrfK